MKARKICAVLVSTIFSLILLWLAFTNRKLLEEPIQKYMNKESTFQEMSVEIASTYLSHLKQKNTFVNLNGLFVRLSGSRVCNAVVRLDNGFLTDASVSPYDMTEHAESLIAFSNTLEEMGIPFVYVQAPAKIDINNSIVPDGITNAFNENADQLLNQIQDKGVQTIDLRVEMADTPEHIKQYFYKTDHHWTPLGGFYAFQRISDYMQTIFPDKDIAGKYQDIENWDIHRKNNWFLGSKGKRTGTYFVGTDDLIWMTPKFETNISGANIYRDAFYYGDFTAANIRSEYIEECDYFGKNAYCVYIGGDYPLIQHRNTSAPANMKLLIIKDSFVLPVQSFFSTVFSEVDVIDPRHYTIGTLIEYINDSAPDMVMMLVNSSAISLDPFFVYGLPFDPKIKTQTGVLVEKQNFFIEASPENRNHYISIYDQLEGGKQYIFSCRSTEILGGETGGISLKIYDAENNQMYNASMIDIAYCEATGNYEWTFTTPNVEGNLKFLIYAGIAEHTENISVQINDAELILKE